MPHSAIHSCRNGQHAGSRLARNVSKEKPEEEGGTWKEKGKVGKWVEKEENEGEG